MKQQTREKLLEQAEKHFSRKGFYGTSINDVAADVNVSKQGLLHHFPSKEKLYAAVLQRCADRLLELVRQAKSTSDTPVEQLIGIVKLMNRANPELLNMMILLMRELLDNRERAEASHRWFMGPFLNELVQIVANAQQQGTLTQYHPLAFIYQLLGATQYFLVSQPTLRQLYSKREFETHRQQHLAQLEKLVRS